MDGLAETAWCCRVSSREARARVAGRHLAVIALRGGPSHDGRRCWTLTQLGFGGSTGDPSEIRDRHVEAASGRLGSCRAR